MNAGIYRLIYNEFRGLWMVVSEFSKSHQPGQGARGLRRLAMAMALAGGAASQALAGPAADALPDVAVSVGAHTVINAPVVNPLNAAGRLLNIQQADQKAILQGSSFDIGRASAVNFNHTGGAGSATLVRITGARTTIEGGLNSPNGDIYLINQNGVLFGNGARVNVNGLVASALDIKDSDFLSDLGHLNGYEAGNVRSVYNWGGDSAGFSSSLVQLDPDARIKAALGGSVMLFAPRVINKGSIETNQGQVVMAAGAKVYLSYAPDPNSGVTDGKSYSYSTDSPYRALAGVLVEVDPYVKQAGDAASEPAERTGSVINDISGRILAQRGNVTMASYLVNQSGRVVATTAVAQKGSIRLLARDNKADIATKAYEKGDLTTKEYESGTTSAAFVQPQVITATRSGELIFGENSVTMILPEHAAGAAIAKQHLSTDQEFLSSVLGALTDTGSTLTDEQIFNKPLLEGIGRNVTVQDGSKIIVPGGFIKLSAQSRGDTVDRSTSQPNTRLYLGKNTLIDASGLKNVAIDSDRNFVEALLTLNDLQDNPLNKNGFLYRKKVWFDIRNLPDSRVANLAGLVKQIPRNIGEKLATAGSVDLGSEGDIVQRTGAKVDVSGGSLLFSAATHKETWLRDASGKAYAIGDAPAGVLFTGFLGPNNYRLSYEPGYVEGAKAGSISLESNAMSLDGQFNGAAIYGDYQRNSANLGGNLTLSLNSNADINIVKNPAAISSDFAAGDALPVANSNTTTIDADKLSASGLENISISTVGGDISSDATLNLATGSKLSLKSGGSLSVNNNITSRGGTVKLVSGGQSTVGQGVNIDVSGLWVNDYLKSMPATGRIVIKGGDISLNSSTGVVLGQGSVLDVSGGGWLNAKKKLSNGDAGGITIAATANVAPTLAGELRGYALGVGASLNITAPFVTVGNAGFGGSRELWLTPDFFRTGGFTSYSLTGGDGVLVRAGTQVNVTASNYQLKKNYINAGTGSHVADFSTVSFLPDYQRSSTSLSLGSEFRVSTAFLPSGIDRGSVVVETGALLQVDSHGNRYDSSGNKIAPKIELSGWENLTYIDGTLRADGGNIAINMKGEPGSLEDNDFNPNQAIWLGSNARLLAAGYSQLIPDSRGLRVGDVYDAGSISLDAKKGYIVTEAGSLLDVSGASAVLDIKGNSRYQPTTVSSNGGAINFTAREGMLLDATLKASSPGALGGSLNINLGRGQSTTLGLVASGGTANYPGYVDHFPNQEWVIDVTQSAGAGFANGLQVGNDLQSSAPGVAKVAADSINTAGFSKATLKSEDSVRFNGDVTLTLPSQLRLDAPKIEATANSNVTLNAPVVMLSNTLLSSNDVQVRTSSDYIAATPSIGNATFTANSNLLDLRGQFALSGFSQTTLNSTADIRLTGFSNSDAAPIGALRTTGKLDMTGRQIYPTTISSFTISAEGAGGEVEFHGTGAHDTVLSAGGTLTVNAENIKQNGVLLAPFGKIALNASQTLSLGDGSLTSVSANGALIPFGFTSRDGLDYLYNFGTGLTSIAATPERVVKLSAPNVTESTSSIVDISGGGDLYAYEWVPGTGGSADVLVNGANQNAFSVLNNTATNTWAIMPASNSTFASYDPQYWSGSGIQAGDAVYLSGVPGLAAGYYTLLPARYALLPGAMLVSAVSGKQDLIAGKLQTQNDGSALVSGHLGSYTSGGYVQTARTGGFLVRAGSDARKLSEYTDTFSSKRFATVTNDMHTVDAGRFSIAATSNLVLDGVLKAMRGQGGRGAEVDVAAPKLLIVDHGAQTGSVQQNGQTYLAVDENTLTNMNAASLLLGGTRSNGVVDVISSEVQFGNNANITGTEVILAATDTVSLKAGSSVTGTGTGSPSRDLTIGNDNVDGDGALLRVAASDKVNLTRNNTDRDRGDLLIEQGAVVHGDGSTQLDATRSMRVAGALEAGAGSALTVAAGKVSLGSPDNGAQVTDGLWLTQSQLAPLQQATSLTLKSYSTIDFYGAVDLGNSGLDLTLQGAGIGGYQNTGQTASITARNLNLNNKDNVAFANAGALSDGLTPALGNGNLAIYADTVNAGNNQVRLAGFDQVDITANKEIVVQGNAARATSNEPANRLTADGSLTLNAGRLTASASADYAIDSTNGLLKLQGAANAPTGLSAASAQAAKLQLNGAAVTLANGAIIDTPGAKVTLHATGAGATDNVTLEAGSVIKAQGSTYTLKDQSVALAAGSVRLVSDHGNVDVQSGALIDLSPAVGGNAGKLEVSAVEGNATLAGVIRGGNQAIAIVDAATVNNLSQTLNSLAQFSGAQTYRIRNGNVEIAAADNVATSRFSLTADNGAVNVEGKIDASGDKGGRIEIYAKDNLTVKRGAQLLAKGLADKQTTAGTTGNGGTVVLSSTSGIVNAEASDAGGVAGALIDVSGDTVGSVKGAGGNVILRAARTGAGDGTGVNVDTGATGAITGAANVVVEAVKVTNASTINTALQNTITTQTNNFANFIAANPLGFSLTRDGVAAKVTPGVEIFSSGDLTLANNWIIGVNNVANPTMPDGGILTLRATGDLLLNNNLGYEQYRVSGNTVTTRNGTWSYRLVAGADDSSVNPEAVQAGVGSVVLGADKYVRTGSGFIDVAAGNNIALGNNAAIYTEGTPDISTIAGFSSLVSNFAIWKELYPVNGGDVRLNALGDITGNAAEGQTTNQWLYRAALRPAGGLANPQLRWWPLLVKTGNNVNPAFVNGVAALGGGDVEVNAGHDISNLQFASATNGRMTGDTNQAPDAANLVIKGGGDVKLNAANDIANALLVAGKGEANVRAGGSANVKFELMDASAKAYADSTLNISSVSNPTITASFFNSESSLGSTYFYSYGNNSSVSATSAAGDVTLAGDEVYPASIFAAAPNGDVTTTGQVLYPSATGNATLLAGHNLSPSLIMSDVNPDTIPQINTKPAFKAATVANGVPDFAAYIGSIAHTQGLLHLLDAQPVRFYAGNDVVFDPSLSGTVILPKSVEVYAGRDVVDPNIIVQNNRASDVSVIEAGGSIRYNEPDRLPDGSIVASTATLQVAGPGRLQLVAGKDVDLGSAEGIRSVGDLYNPYLSSQGADIMVYPGALGGLDYTAMIAAYLEPSTAGALASTYLPQLVSYMQTLQGDSNLSTSDALTQFKSLDAKQQSQFINTVFYAELRASGRDAIDSKSLSFGDYSRAERAILRMFPDFTKNTSLVNQTGSLMNAFKEISGEAISSPGDLKLFYSQIRSERGGRIELLVPGGLINAGLAVAGTLNKPATDLGIVSVRGGDVDAFVRGNFQVNQSRVFTLGGSDLMLYSALSNIDAGRGAKTSSATPPPVLRIKNGQVFYDYSSAVSGSGIAALTATGGAPGTVDLFAPYGEINAGEAGIRSAGNINLGARVIIGAENIQAGGVTTGVPAVSTAGLSISAGATTDPTSSSKSGEQLAKSASSQAGSNKSTFLPSFITVEVLGVGDESASPASDGKKSDKK